MENPANSDENFYVRELGFMRLAFDAGNISGVLEALQLCRQRGIASPAWVLDAAYSLIIEAAAGRPKKRGRASNRFARFRQDFIHFLRYDTIIEIREKQAETAQSVKELEDLKNPPMDRLQEGEHLLKAIGRSWEDAYVAASRGLSLSAARGSPETMKNSYQLVTRAMKTPMQSGRFRLTSRQVIFDLGLYGDLGSGDWDKKFMQLILSAG